MSTSSLSNKSLFYVPYGGHMQKISANDVNSLSVKEEGPVADTYAIQQSRIAEADIDCTMISPAKGGGFIIKCADKDIQKAYDSVFGGSSVSATKTRSIVVEFPKADKPASGFSASFTGAALNDNGVSRAPDVEGVFAKAAAKAPMLGTPSFIAGFENKAA